MRTRRINSPGEAAQTIRDGGLVAFPTETVFGLGVDATNSVAVEKLFKAKGRPSNNPLIVHLGETNEWSLAASSMTPNAEALLSAFAPGPLTVVLPKRAEISSLVTAGLETVGLRIPSHPVAMEILRRVGVPVAAPSANRSGRPSGTTWQAVLEDLDGRIDAVYCEDCNRIGIESTVVDCCGPVTTVLRPGAITIEQIRQIVPDAQELDIQGDFAGVGGGVMSPGILHPHYQPRAEVRLVEYPSSNIEVRGVKVAYCGMQPLVGLESIELNVTFPTVDAYAAGFYEFLRQADRQSIPTVFAQKVPNEGIGRALLDRQLRASNE